MSIYEQNLRGSTPFRKKRRDVPSPCSDVMFLGVTFEPSTLANLYLTYNCHTSLKTSIERL